MAKFDNLIVSKTVQADRFWILGDVHGMVLQFRDLLTKIEEFEMNLAADADDDVRPVERVSFVCVGDICDRGPASLETLHYCFYFRSLGWHGRERTIPFYNVLGNHDYKLLRALGGHAVKRTHGLDKTMYQIEGVGAPMMKKYMEFLEQTPLTLRLVLPDGREAVVVHAGFHPSFQTFGSERAWGTSHTAEYALFGPVSGIQPDGMPIRIAWEDEYKGTLKVFYGHKVVEGVVPKFTDYTCNVDTGCFQTGVLSAVSFPDLHILQVYGSNAVSYQ